MPKTKKVLLPLDLIGYDVYIEDRTSNSDYFKVSRLPSIFAGGKNSFLIEGSDLLQNGSEILIEILDSNKNTIYQTVVENYIEANSKMLSVEIYDTTPSGPAYIIMMGKAVQNVDGTAIPPEWENVYNVRWIRQVLVDYDVNNTAPIVFEKTPQISVVENRFLSILSSSYTTQTIPVSASLTPITTFSVHSGYSIKAFDKLLTPNYINPIITGSFSIEGSTRTITLPITKILNDSTAYSYGYYLQLPNSTDSSSIIKTVSLKSGSYFTNIVDKEYEVTSSAVLEYSTLNTASTNEPVSYANIRISNLNTVSGELYKVRVYSKVATATSNYKLVADVPVVTEELLITASTKGIFPIGDISQTPNVEQNWYAGQLTQNAGIKNIIYPISGTMGYYNPALYGGAGILVSASSDVLLSSLYADVPVENSVPFKIIPDTELTSSKYFSLISQYGYFIGTKRYVTVFPTTEYTLELDAYYRTISGSRYLEGVTPKVDIYVVGDSGSRLITDNPLGQKIGELKVLGETQWFEKKQFNFVPKMPEVANVGIRLVVSNGFWHFANISLKPASDARFSPDEVQILVPNTEYYNELLQYKVEFFNIDNSSAQISAISTPTFFTGSSIDLGTIS